MEYRILTAPGLDALGSLVSRFTTQGWHPSGNPFALHTHGHYGQAITKPINTIPQYMSTQSSQNSTQPPQVQPSMSTEDTRLFNALREKRTELATHIGAPAYCIATNRALQNIIERKPTTIEEFQTVYGFGPQKTALYGEAFLKVLRENQTSQEVTVPMTDRRNSITVKL